MAFQEFTKELQDAQMMRSECVRIAEEATYYREQASYIALHSNNHEVVEVLMEKADDLQIQEKQLVI